MEGNEGFTGYEAWLWLQGYNPYIHATPAKPPLLYLFYVIPIHFFGNTIIPVRLINNFIFLLSIVALYLIARDWYGKRVALISAIFYGIFMNAPAFQAAQAMDGSFSMPFVIFAIYFCSKYLQGGKRSSLLISGLSISIALLIRQDRAVGIILLLIMTASTRHKFSKEGFKSKLHLNKRLATDISILLLGILLPILIIVTYSWSEGVLDDLIDCTILVFSRVNYFSQRLPFDHRFLTLVEGLPLWLLSILGFLVCILRWNKNNISDKILMTWMVLFTSIASIPPDFGSHYVHVIAPASVLSGIGLASISNNVKLQSIRGSIGNYRQNVAAIFAITIIVLSFLPSIFLQAQQYPDFHIHWEFIHYEYAGDQGAWTYNEQLELGDYLRSNTPENGEILIYAWTATPYWLSGHKAPSKYISPIIYPLTPGVPEEEFKRLTDMVKADHFDYIVFFSQDLNGLQWRRQFDPIVDYTLRKYFYAKTIMTAQIFSKYDSEGYHVYYNFIESFSKALKEYELENGTIRNTEGDFENQEILIPKISTLDINGDIRDAIRHHPLPSATSYIEYDDIFVQPDSKLKFGIGMNPAIWNTTTDGVLFEIFITVKYTDAARIKIFSKYINPKENPSDRKWHDYEINLSEYSNKNVTLYFVTSAGPANDDYGDWAYWSNPLICRKSDR